MNQSAIEASHSPVWDVCIIGAGPSGMMAAGFAAQRGRRVIILDKNPAPGKKLLITGGGRCNVTNNKPVVRDMLARYVRDGKYLFSTFAQHSVPDTIEFFRTHGVELKEENEGRLFPVSDSAQSIYDALLEHITRPEVHLQTNAVVREVSKNPDTGVFTISLCDDEEIQAHACVIAAGGTSRPDTGSTGECFTWLASLGHTILPNSAALVPIALKDTWVAECAGLTVPDAKLTVFAGTKKHRVERGKFLFTHVGASGPVILNMSTVIGELLKQDTVTLMLDLFPGLDHGALKLQLQTLLTKESNKMLKNVLTAILPSALVPVLLQTADVEGETYCHSVRSEDRSKLVALCKAVPLHVHELLGPEKAIVSSGGVVLDEVDFRTMESRIVPGLYLVGDVLNIDRPSGGYSLQVCWSTGFVAGMHA